jgi:hypothetical protein
MKERDVGMSIITQRNIDAKRHDETRHDATRRDTTRRDATRQAGEMQFNRRIRISTRRRDSIGKGDDEQLLSQRFIDHALAGIILSSYLKVFSWTSKYFLLPLSLTISIPRPRWDYNTSDNCYMAICLNIHCSELSRTSIIKYQCIMLIYSRI